MLRAKRRENMGMMNDMNNVKPEASRPRHAVCHENKNQKRKRIFRLYGGRMDGITQQQVFGTLYV